MGWRRAVLFIFIIFLGGCYLNQGLVRSESPRVVCKVTLVKMGENTRLIYEFDGFTISFIRTNDGATRMETIIKESGGEERNMNDLKKEMKDDQAKIMSMYDLIYNCNDGIKYF